MVDTTGGCHPILFIDPVHLLFLTPDEIPVIGFGLTPLAVQQSSEYAITKGSLELYVGAEIAVVGTSGWGSVLS